MHQRHLTHSTQFSQGKTDHAGMCWHQHRSCYSRKDAPQILPSPDAARHRCTLHCAPHKSWHLGQRSCSHQGLCPPCSGTVPHGSVPSCILQCDLLQIPSHHIPCTCDCPEQRLCFLDTLVTRRVSPVEIPWQLFYCSPA